MPELVDLTGVRHKPKTPGGGALRSRGLGTNREYFSPMNHRLDPLAWRSYHIKPPAIGS
jgi:hypothetical protein